MSWTRPAELDANDATGEGRFSRKDPKADFQRPPDRKVEVTNPEEARKLLFALFRDKEIQTTTKWEEVREQLQDDERFTMVPSLKDRKQIFKKYIETEKANYKNSIRDLKFRQREDFKRMLEEYQHINIETKISSLLPIFYQDPRWTRMDDKEREDAFLEYMEELYGREADTEKKMIAEQSDRVRKLLLENQRINSGTTWGEVQELMRGNTIWNELHNYYKLKWVKQRV